MPQLFLDTSSLHISPMNSPEHFETQKKVLARKNKWKFWTERKRSSLDKLPEDNTPGKKEYLKDLVQAPIFSNHDTIMKFAMECCNDDSITKILLFKSWIEPVWEDKHNLNGGRFFIGCNNMNRAKKVFLHVITRHLGMKNNSFLEDSFVCGMGLSIKESEFSVQIWHSRFRNKYTFPSILNRIRSEFPEERVGHLNHCRFHEKLSPKNNAEQKSTNYPINQQQIVSDHSDDDKEPQLSPTATLVSEMETPKINQELEETSIPSANIENQVSQVNPTIPSIVEDVEIAGQRGDLNERTVTINSFSVLLTKSTKDMPIFPVSIRKEKDVSGNWLRWLVTVVGIVVLCCIFSGLWFRESSTGMFLST
eukprot:TRINITY_DN3622_c0_g1_i2.p1 TRINITY_DN3622_c0_g1~~TRINITY_DN3622_c0_g1_i2.p1  ORF type:complete len:399 (-),score=60.14 TRINITY_DN3622_c0_g1_i2:21-1115(-)